MAKQEQEFFMRRALELASLGRGNVSPNPMVGCVIVHEGIIIGEGWHRKYGEAHAEVNAVNAVRDRSLLRESTVYVNLEPCSHFGKTPPCADMLIREQVKKVVIANLDSNPLVAGNGVKKLTDAGIVVETNVLAGEGRELNQRFFTAMEQKRPFILLKWAQTADGFIARENFDSKWISSSISRQLVHKWRSEEDAILVGSRTAAHDNPQLNVRDWSGKDPVRVVIDRSLKLDPSLHLFDGRQNTIVYNTLKNEERTNLTFVRLPEPDLIPPLLDHLMTKKIHSLIVEGGAGTLQAFIDLDLWDEARVFVSSDTFQKGIRAPLFSGKPVATKQLRTDTLTIYAPHGTRQLAQ